MMGEIADFSKNSKGSSMIRAELIAKGKVQKVGYRDFVEEKPWNWD
ncbi:MAG: acylphosphatase [Candidatus Hydrothermarchaeota archaeon]